MVQWLAARGALTTFVGRSAETKRVDALLATEGTRLVTLTGPGGVGKTLALHVVSTRRGYAPAVLVSLGEIADPELVDGTILEVIGGCQVPGQPPIDAAIECLRDREALLILDSCEHLLPAVVPSVQKVLLSCPRLQLLVTSREPLGLLCEVVYPVPPLSASTPENLDGDGQVLSEAAQLFVERGRQAGVDIRPGGEVLGLVDEIVAGVEGIPLAIELAAARTRVLTLDDIAGALGDHLRLLVGGPRAAERRHQTMRASIDWSHVLLAEEEKTLLRRLSVFSGGWTLTAAERVCADDALPDSRILDLLAALVDKSLVIAESESPSVRFRMLTPTQQFASEQLSQAGESQILAGRHCTYYTGLAEQADRELWFLHEAGRARLDQESANLRSAVDWAREAHHGDAVRITAALGMYWRLRGRLSEGIAALESALASTDPDPTADRALALAMLATLMFWQGNVVGSAKVVPEAIAVAVNANATRAHAHALVRLGNATLLTDPRAAQPMLAQAAESAAIAADPIALADALAASTMVYYERGEYAHMEEAAQRAIDVSQAIGYDIPLRWCLWAQTSSALIHGDLSTATRLAQRAYNMPGSKEPFTRACIAEVLSLCYTLRGDPATGKQRALDELKRARRAGVRIGMGMLIHAIARAELASNHLGLARAWARQLLDREGHGVGYLQWRAEEILLSCALAIGNFTDAQACVEGIEEVARNMGSERAHTVAQYGRAWIAMAKHELRSAEELAHAALATSMSHGWWIDAIPCCELLTAASAARGRYERAARLIAGIDNARAEHGYPRSVREQRLWEGLIEEIIQSLPVSQFISVSTEGASMSLTDLAEHLQRGRGRRRRPNHGWEGLTPVELQVAELAAKGLANPQIAQQLFMARSTVKAHLAHVYAKLQVANRTALAARFFSHPTPNQPSHSPFHTRSPRPKRP
ncbi:LuxR C-terminal-related transcriptional regulator [Streptomyces sp. NPDC086835]|uniref:LuxR C-terminal-related transcriptional regulator n=1 Tax=Streptomyces sp. NPDC086835 TaxID=3365761 RepID=UPI00382E49E3